MSQQKVDKYKKDKKKRSSHKKRFSIKENLWKFGMSFVGLIMIGWIVYSGYVKYQDLKPRKYATVDLQGVFDYTSNIKTIDDEDESDSTNSTETENQDTTQENQ